VSAQSPTGTAPLPGPGRLAKVVVVVGAGPGLGLAVARRFSEEGFRPALVSRNPSRLDLADLPGSPPPLLAAADVSDEGSLRAALGEIRVSAGDPEVLVYNPSASLPGQPTQVSYDDFVLGLRIGVAGALVAAQAVAPAMRAAGRGTILMTGSGVALRPWPTSAALSAQKAALRSLALSLAAELRPAGVHVATVTIRGVLEAGTAFDPDLVADRYWELHVEGDLPPAVWRAELEVTADP
jgi:NAD(P)-dependent dehydrogenase (short-subunit alcohol dehydrogenase family)